jgi:hypothetical protein
MALIGTMTALVLGLLIASAKSSFNTQKSEVTQMAANIIQLDRILGRYGAGANGARAVLRRAVLSVDQSWSEDAARSERLDSAQVRAEAASFYEKIQELTPRNDFEHYLQSQALLTALEIGQTRALLVEQAGSSIPMPFLVVMVFWLAVIFASFGLFAPRNATVIATLFVCALSVSGAIFLILELDSSVLWPDANLRRSLAQRHHAHWNVGEQPRNPVTQLRRERNLARSGITRESSFRHLAR